MSTQALHSAKILKFALWCIGLSAVAALAFWAGCHTPLLSGPSAGVGVMAALIGSGVSLWFSFRARDAVLAAAGLVSLFPLAFWCWQIYEVVHG